MIVWSLWHSRNLDPQEEGRLVGVFSSLDILHIQIERLSAEGPLSEFPDGFTVDKHEVDIVADVALREKAEQGDAANP